MAGSLAAAAVARHAEVPVWVVAGVGRLLPERMWGPVVERAVPGDVWDANDEVVPLSLVDRIVGPTGPLPVVDALRRTDYPVATELFKGDVV